MLISHVVLIGLYLHFQPGSEVKVTFVRKVISWLDKVTETEETHVK